MKTAILCYITAFLFFAATSAFAIDISGTYICQGHAPGGEEYTDGVLTVIKSKNLYDFTWTFPKEKSSTKGTGVYNTEDESSIAVLFTFQPPTPKEIGVIIYKVSNGTIKGNAILSGKKIIGGEICTKK
jgi:hypothetical protein